MQYAETHRSAPIHPSQAPEILRLRAKVETLEEANRQLMEAIAGDAAERSISRYRSVFGLKPGEAKLLIALMHGKVLRREALVYAVAMSPMEVPEPQIVTVYVHRIRKALEGHEVIITNQRGAGYCISDESRERIRELLGEGAMQE